MFGLWIAVWKMDVVMRFGREGRWRNENQSDFIPYIDVMQL